MIRAVISDFGGVLTSPLAGSFHLSGFAELLGELAPNEPMIALMASLREDGWRMALLTNNVREWEKEWRAMAPIDEIFEVVVDSAFVGVRKPDPEIYELTAARLGVPASACLFVDDREDNCAGALAAGMTAVRYRGVEQATAEIRAALGGGGVG